MSAVAPTNGRASGRGRRQRDGGDFPVARAKCRSVGLATAGACREENPELFFHPEGERGPSRRNRESAAKAVCARCPVVTECAVHALAVREPYGVWGGLSEDDREAVYLARRKLATAS